MMKKLLALLWLIATPVQAATLSPIMSYDSVAQTLSLIDTTGTLASICSVNTTSHVCTVSTAVPPPTTTTLGGLFSYAPVTNQFLTSVSTTGQPASAQPAFPNLSGSLGSAQFPALSGDCTTSGFVITCTKINGNTVSTTYATIASVAASYAPLASPALTGTPTAPTATAGTNTTQLATTAFVATAASGVMQAPRSSVRQTVQGGPASAGLPSFIPATSASLSITTTGISTSIPLYVASAQGFNGTGQNDIISAFTANLIFTCAASTQCYEYVNASTGTTSTQTLVPIYQCGGALAVTSGQFSFDYCGGGTGGTGTQAGQPYVAYMGNGTSAVETPLVAVGECTAGASTLSGCFAYAYNGAYIGGFIATLPANGVATAVSHNLGVADAIATLQVKCITAENGYSVGDIVSNLGGFDGTFLLSITPWLQRNTGGYTVPTNSLFVVGKVNGTRSALTPANWAYRLIFKRSGFGGS